MKTTFDALAASFNRNRFKKMHEEMSFEDYIDLVQKRPTLAHSAYQRLYSMIISAGVKQKTIFRKTVTEYNFFNDDDIPIYGLHQTLEGLVKHVRGAANWHGPERRILLLKGPVGSSKSTICRRLKRGLENYSQTDEGALHSYTWTGLDGLDIKDSCPCPLNDDPLKLLPVEMRSEFFADLNGRLEEMTPEKDRINLFPLRLVGELNPQCKFFMSQLLKKYDGDWATVVKKHIKVRRVILSEADRVGIATFQPKDPKNQDATELTGDINYMKLGHYGVDSDPRAFSFDGEFEVANRGFLELIEGLKLEKEFLYDLLGACQERQIKPKKFSQIDVDIVLVSHSNLPEFEKLKADNTMEAFRDRTVPVDVPYLTELDHEIAVLNHDYGKNKIKQHVAPHTIETAALWAVLTRMRDEKDMGISPVEKVKLYNGKTLTGWTEEKVRELRDKNERYQEGMTRGVSARFVQNAISNCLVTGKRNYINPFMVLGEIREKLKYLMISDKSEIQFYDACVDLAKKELDDILKDEVQKALVGDESAIERLFTSYVDNVVAHCEGSKIKDQYTGRDVDPDERLMRSIEEKAEVAEGHADDFRRQIAQYFFTMQHHGKVVRWDSNARLAKALQKKIYEDTKDHIKLSKLSSGAMAADKSIQDKIDAIKRRMIENFGYNEESATDVLNYVSSIFARGELANQE